MEKQFCSYEIALALKELGFDETCLAIWSAAGDHLFIEYTKSQNQAARIYQSKSVSAPLWQQAIDFFIEKHNIYIDLVGTYSYQQGVGRWFKMYDGVVNYMPSDSNDWEGTSCGDDESSLHDARKQAILKCIEICQKRK